MSKVQAFITITVMDVGRVIRVTEADDASETLRIDQGDWDSHPLYIGMDALEAFTEALFTVNDHIRYKKKPAEEMDDERFKTIGQLIAQHAQKHPYPRLVDDADPDALENGPERLNVWVEGFPDPILITETNDMHKVIRRIQDGYGMAIKAENNE